MMKRTMRRLLGALIFFGAAAGAVDAGRAQTATGLVLERPAALYDSHSERARPIWILSGGHPARRLTSVTGWHKVETHRPEVTGWVRAEETRPGNWLVAKAARVELKVEPAAAAANAAVVAAGTMLEALSPTPFCGAGGCWHHAAHPDGETGYVRAAAVWRNF